MKRIYLLITAIFIAGLIYGQKLQFASIFCDNAVLQQNTVVKIWGSANPESSLTLNASWDNKSYKATSDKEGSWLISIKTPKADFNAYSIVVESRDEKIAVSNIVFGEVWLCSGQSNMEMVLRTDELSNIRVTGSEDVFKQPDNQYLRMFTAGRSEQFFPQKNVVVNGGWKIHTAKNAEWFSAVGFFFGQILQKKLNVPVGIIVSSYGGSPIQCWIPEYQMTGSAIYASGQQNKSREIEYSKLGVEAAKQRFHYWLDNSQKQKSSVLHENIDYSVLPSLILPGYFRNSSVGSKFGGTLLCKEIQIDKPDDLNISLGMIDRLSQIFFNGNLVYENILPSQAYARPKFVVPAKYVSKGKNIISITIVSYLWNGGILGDPLQFFFIVKNESQTQSLAGEWKYKRLFDLDKVEIMPKEGRADPFMVNALYNGMIYPLVNYTIKGVLWYHGSANVSDAVQYPQMLRDMVFSWRKEWGYDFPFYYAQIAPYKYSGANNEESVIMRELMAKAAESIPNSGMVVTLDVGEADNIHPPRKKEVGERLANWALGRTYKVEGIKYENPEPIKFSIVNGRIEILFSNTYGGIELKGDDADLEISQDGTNYIKARFNIVGDKLVIYQNSIVKPQSIRYAWKNAAQGTLFGKSGLPFQSFRYSFKN